MAFFYEKQNLRCGAGPGAPSAGIADIARAHGTPAYIYDLDAVQARARLLQASVKGLNVAVHYALKANPCSAVVRALREVGCGADVVSGGEIDQAAAGGVDARDVIFSGVAKTEREIEHALRLGVKQLNVESPQELTRIAKIARSLGKTADVAFRMNPDVNPETHPYITTGFRDNKFGMDESFLPELLETVRAAGSALRLRGLTLHIGSQLLEIGALREAVRKTKATFLALRAHGFALDRFDAGGGVGIDYSTPDDARELGLLADYGAMLRTELGDLSGCEILLEPGRILVGRAGILVGEVQYVKRAPAKTFAILDTGMHHLLRPALYQAKHRVLPVGLREEPRDARTEAYDIVGPICESSDFLARDAMLPPLEQGDLLAIADAGAYGRSMASTYNAHALPVEIAVAGGVASKV